MSGWPKSITVSTSSPALGDLDGDGDLEIVIGEGLSGGSRLFAWHNDGSKAFETAMDSWNIWSSPVLADLTGDGRLEKSRSASYCLPCIRIRHNRKQENHKLGSLSN